MASQYYTKTYHIITRILTKTYYKYFMICKKVKQQNVAIKFTSLTEPSTSFSSSITLLSESTSGKLMWVIVPSFPSVSSPSNGLTRQNTRIFPCKKKTFCCASLAIIHNLKFEQCFGINTFKSRAYMWMFTCKKVNVVPHPLKLFNI